MIGSALGIAIPLVTAIGAAFMRTRKEAEDTTTVLDTVTSALSTVNSAVDIQTSSLEDLREKYGELAEEIHGLQVNMAETAALGAFLKLRDEASEATGVIGDLIGAMDKIDKYSEVGPMQRPAVNRSLVEGANEEIEAISKKLGLSTESAKELGQAFFDIQNSATLEGQSESLTSIADILGGLPDSVKEQNRELIALVERYTRLAQSVAALNKAQEEANNASSSAQSENQTALEKRLKALRDERAELKRNFALIQSEYTALDLSLRRSEGVDTQLNRVLAARVVSYAEMIDQQREQTGISYEQGSQMVALYEETERLRLQTEMLLKPAIKFAEEVESSRYDAEVLAKMDIDRSLIDAAIQSGLLSENMANALLAAVALVDKAPELAQIGARMAANMSGKENLPPIEEGPGSTRGNFLTLGSMGELPTGKKKKAEQPDRIGALARSLATEAEMLESWRSEGLLQIQDFNAKELELLGGHQAAVERLEQEHQNRLNTIEQTARQKKLSDTAGMFGALASIAETGGKKTAKAAATAQAIEGTVNAYGAAIKALNTPGISLAGRFTAYASVLAAGLKGVQSIKQAGGVSAGGSGGSGSIATPSSATEAAPQRVLVEGIGPNDLISGTQLSEIFDRLYEEDRKSVV